MKYEITLMKRAYTIIMVEANDRDEAKKIARSVDTEGIEWRFNTPSVVEVKEIKDKEELK